MLGLRKSFRYRDSLEYTAPSVGDWGLVHVLTLIPELHALFVAPAACGRHTALGALQQGIKDHVSYYYLSIDEIISGYDRELVQAASDLLGILPKRPKALAVVVSCLDDLIGTDLDSLMVELKLMHPDVDFMAGHMNPITGDTDSPPLVTNQRQMFSLIRPVEEKERDGGVNLIGTFVPLLSGSELYEILESLGASCLRQLPLCNTYCEFQKMGCSCLNLVLSPTAVSAGISMQQRLSIPSLDLFVSYRLETIEYQYKKIKEAWETFVSPLADPERFQLLQKEARKAAEEAIDKALSVIGQREIWISGGSVSRPFETARALIEYGFRVGAVIAQKQTPYELEAANWLQEHCPDMLYLQTQHVESSLGGSLNPDILAIGFNAAYQAGCSRVVPILNDDGLYGYYGTQQMMVRMMDAAENPICLEHLIRSYGLII